ncbi:ABC transporter permease [Iodidimonas gelatinilytica]|uniref:ABC transporter permease n=1 Tax=Iodidimonas gelatinilytica TaxID=1236966 RepID=A0A5A7MMS5_9PROT|nr:ABC transporter permease subunit [Iodidimonas gelatinilytica]GEQ97291.1 ABC transporter permease [Iodidimonas gelatinilytica]
MSAALTSVFKREFTSYFSTPVAIVFIVIYLMLSGVFTFYVGGFYERGQADLSAFFTYQPWLFLFLIPAISMRLWAEERKSGTIELLLTLPVGTWSAVLGKFLAAWALAALALMLTFPIWITVNYLGDPDNGVILASYLAALLMAGGYLAIGAAMSAATRNQVIAFVLAIALCFLFTVSGLPIILAFFEGWAPDWLATLVADFSFLTHFSTLSKGVLEAADILYFLSLIGLWLFLGYLIIELKREDN